MICDVRVNCVAWLAKQWASDLDVTGSRPLAVTRHIRYGLFVIKPTLDQTQVESTFVAVKSIGTLVVIMNMILLYL